MQINLLSISPLHYIDPQVKRPQALHANSMWTSQQHPTVLQLIIEYRLAAAIVFAMTGQYISDSVIIANLCAMSIEIVDSNVQNSEKLLRMENQEIECLLTSEWG